MFSQRYAKEVLESRINDLPQLDRIELQGKLNKQRLILNEISVDYTRELILGTLFSLSAMSYYVSTAYLGLLKAPVIFHKMGFVITSIMACCWVLTAIGSCIKQSKITKQFSEDNEDFIEDRLE